MKLIKLLEEHGLCAECGMPLEEKGMCTECGWMDEALIGGQKKLDVAEPFGKLTGADFKKLRSVKEEDHEVSMAGSSLSDIIRNAEELLQKIGSEEKDIPAWIQDHITNAQNYVTQANTNYYDQGSEQDSTLTSMMQETDISANDPVLMKMRAAKHAPQASMDRPLNFPNLDRLKKALDQLEAERNTIMSDMEQEAEPEGGPTADYYGELLNKTDSLIKKLKLKIASMQNNSNTSLVSMMQELFEAKKKPSSGLSKKQKSVTAKKAKAGKDIGKKGKGFEKVAKKAAKKYGSAEKGKKVAAAAMWKGVKARSKK